MGTGRDPGEPPGCAAHHEAMHVPSSRSPGAGEREQLGTALGAAWGRVWVMGLPCTLMGGGYETPECRRAVLLGLIKSTRTAGDAL